jgi:hypothetical protein
MNGTGCTEMTCPRHGEENRRLRESIERGLAQSAAGETVDLGSFAGFVSDDPEENA